MTAARFQEAASLYLNRPAVCVSLLVTFRKGSHSLPCVTGRIANIPKAQRVCTLFQTGNIWDEQHLVFECPALQQDRDNYNSPLGGHAATMVQFMWQHDLCAVAQEIKDELDACGDPGPQSQASAPLGFSLQSPIPNACFCMVCLCCMLIKCKDVLNQEVPWLPSSLTKQVHLLCWAAQLLGPSLSCEYLALISQHT